MREAGGVNVEDGPLQAQTRRTSTWCIRSVRTTRSHARTQRTCACVRTPGRSSSRGARGVEDAVDAEPVGIHGERGHVRGNERPGCVRAARRPARIIFTDSFERLNTAVTIRVDEDSRRVVTALGRTMDGRERRS
jgi:hypothetical protein